MPILTGNAVVDALYAAWRAASAKHGRRDTDETYMAEQRAWDELRDACDAAFGHDCPHPECPHPTQHEA